MKIKSLLTFFTLFFCLISNSIQAATLTGNASVDNSYTMYLSTSDSVAGTQISVGSNWAVSNAIPATNLVPGQNYFLHVLARDFGVKAGFLGDFTISGTGHTFVNGLTTVETGTNWRVSTTGWAGYVQASTYGLNSAGLAPWNQVIAGVNPTATRIWSVNNAAVIDTPVYFTIAIRATVTSVPTLSQWGLILLSLMLLGVGLRKKINTNI